MTTTTGRILAIDPGTTETGYIIVEFDKSGIHILEFGKIANEKMLELVLKGKYDRLAVEMIASYGMPVGKSTFETVLWIGRFIQAGRVPPQLIYRKTDVCTHLCMSTKAKDANIRQALIDRFGEPGTKANPGVLYGIAGDVWSALAIAVTYAEKMLGGNNDTQKTA